MTNTAIPNSNSSPTLDFDHVSREVKSLVTRRRELMMFLGSLFVALSIYLDNLLHGSLPPALTNLSQHAFFTYSLMLLIPSIIIALRIMKLHGGMTINGIFYHHILLNSGNQLSNPIAASRLNWSGISTGLFLLTVLDATLATILFTLSLHLSWIQALIMGSGSAIILIMLFLRNHRQVAQFALSKITQVTIEPPNLEALKNHLAQSLQDANQDMIGITAFVGLILFSVMENLSGLGNIQNYQGDISATEVLNFGPLIYSTLALVTSVVGTLTYRRLAVAAGELSLQLDPTDDPFNLLKLTDTFLGYLMLCVLFGISLHLTIFITLEDNVFAQFLEIALNGLMIALYPLRVLRINQN